MVSVSASIARRGVRGGVAPFVPTDVAGTVLWLRADLGVTLDTGGIATWADQSGQGNDFAQAVEGSRPDILGAQADMNNQLAVDFDGEYFEAADFDDPGETEMFLVMSKEPWPGIAAADTGIWYFSNYTFDDTFGSATEQCFLSFNSTGRPDTNADDSLPDCSVPFTLNIIATDDEWTMNHNDTEHYNRASNVRDWNVTPRLGASKTPGTFLFGGRMAELIIYGGGKLSADNRALVLAYLYERYSITP